jgi:hypothetical protein
VETPVPCAMDSARVYGRKAAYREDAIGERAGTPRLFCGRRGVLFLERSHVVFSAGAASHPSRTIAHGKARRMMNLPDASTFRHAEDCPTPDAQLEWFDRGGGVFQRVCSCHTEVRYPQPEARPDPLDPAVMKHGPGCTVVGQPAVLRHVVQLTHEPSYTYATCGVCAYGWCACRSATVRRGRPPASRSRTGRRTRRTEARRPPMRKQPGTSGAGRPEPTPPRGAGDAEMKFPMRRVHPGGDAAPGMPQAAWSGSCVPGRARPRGRA